MGIEISLFVEMLNFFRSFFERFLDFTLLFHKSVFFIVTFLLFFFFSLKVTDNFSELAAVNVLWPAIVMIIIRHFFSQRDAIQEYIFSFGYVQL